MTETGAEILHEYRGTKFLVARKWESQIEVVFGYSNIEQNAEPPEILGYEESNWKLTSFRREPIPRLAGWCLTRATYRKASP